MIEVGEYVRTTDGEIHKIKSIEENFIEFENGYGISVREIDYIINHSKNIIDLIEVGDYVNGSKVINKLYENEKDIPTIIRCLNENGFKENDIKSIVTKEMYKNIEYRLE